jgi:hypothetical protein
MSLGDVWFGLFVIIIAGYLIPTASTWGHPSSWVAKRTSAVR